MTEGVNPLMNKAMGLMVKSMFVAIPAACASGAAYDIWIQGFRSPLLQIAIGIVALFLVLKTVRLAFTAADALFDAAHAVRPVIAGFRARTATRITAVARRAAGILDDLRWTHTQAHN
jgi:hypothetical protein